MWLAGLLLLCSLPVQGDIKMTLESAVYPGADSSAVLELSYEIPYTSLMFLREDGGFAARYQIGVQVMDRRRNILAGDVWQRAVRVADYDPTVARDSVESGVVSLRLPGGAVSAHVETSDGVSDRSARSDFALTRPTGGLVLRLIRQGRPVGTAKYGLGDTIQALAEQLLPGVRFDSCRFTLLSGNRPVTGMTVPAFDTADHRAARFEYAIADTHGMARLSSGEYHLQAVSGAAKSGVNVRVSVTFFYNDKAYAEKVDQLLYIATYEEMRRLRVVPRSEREQAWRDFWKAKDQTPTTQRNEREEEYFERIDYAQVHFGHGDRGYRSDRGNVYVLHGPPDQIDARPFELDVPASETWYYYESNRRFVFVDRYGAGEFVLLNREALIER